MIDDPHVSIILKSIDSMIFILLIIHSYDFLVAIKEIASIAEIRLIILLSLLIACMSAHSFTNKFP